jgi:hypothetical protein
MKSFSRITVRCSVEKTTPKNTSNPVEADNVVFNGNPGFDFTLTLLEPLQGFAGALLGALAKNLLVRKQNLPDTSDCLLAWILEQAAVSVEDLD